MNYKKMVRNSFALFLILILVQTITITLLTNSMSNIEQNRSNIEQILNDKNMLHVEQVRKQQRDELKSIKESWAINVNSYYNEELTDEQAKELLKNIIKPRTQLNDFIAYDSKSGEIIIDTTNECRTGNIFTDHLHINNSNPEESLKTIDLFMRNTNSSTSSDKEVYMFNEKAKMGNDKSNFIKFPLGSYDRLFIEKIVLPFDNVGYSENKQISIISLIEEDNIYKNLKHIDSKFEKVLTYEKDAYKNIELYIFILTVVGMLNILNFLFVIQKVKLNK